MHPTELFVYGTLRHDRPEHAKYCRGVLGWRPARIRGSLWSIPAGYRLVVVPPGDVLLAATPDAVADEARRKDVNAAAIAAASATSEDVGGIEGEVLTFRDAVEAWPPIDAWEEFTPDRPGCYPRVVVPVEVWDHGAAIPRWVAVWAYVATTAPEGSVDVTAWPPRPGP